MEEHNTQIPPQLEEDFDRHEPRTGRIAIVSGATVLLLTAICAGLYWLYVFSSERIEYEQVLAPPSEELKAIHEREEKHLNTYGYINKEKGIVRVPIDRAMEILVSEAKEGKLAYNMKTYAVKPDQLAGAPAAVNPNADQKK